MSTPPDYAGFWLRVAASLIDTVWLCLIVYTLLALLVGPQAMLPDAPYTPLRFLVAWVLPIALVIGFWLFRSATPGKMLLKLKVVDTQTLGPVPMPRLLLRYAGYYVAVAPLALGLLWVGWDARKQGWHDKLAGTLVIRVPGTGVESLQPTTSTSNGAPAARHDDTAWPT